MTHEQITFDSHGVAWHFPAASDALATAAGRPVVVMAPGATTSTCGPAKGGSSRRPRTRWRS